MVHSTRHLLSQVPLADGVKLLTQLNQKDGFDCPGCAWPDPEHERSVVEFCENGVKAIAEEATDAKCDAAFFAANSISVLRQRTDYEIGKSGRLVQPVIKKEGRDFYEPIEWQEAFALIGDNLKQVHPNEAIFYTSGRTSNEAAFLYQLMVRMYGTNNLPDCSNMCHESSGVALTETLGIGKGTVTLEDFNLAEVIVVMGQNPGTNHPRMLSALQDAKRAGAKIITINPIEEAGLIGFRHPRRPWEWLAPPTPITDLWLPVRINEDVALLQAINKKLVEADKTRGNVLDWEFIRSKTAGVEAFTAHLETLDANALVEQSGVPHALVQQAVEMLARHKKIIVCWAMGLTQHLNAVDNIREIVNLLLLKGSVGKPGSGTCPVRGHSNVQGDRTMGIYEKPKAEFLDRMEAVFQFRAPREAGLDTVESIAAMAKGKAKIFIALGGNFLSAAPETDFTAKALENCALTVQISTKLNRSHLHGGKNALILPCLGRTELDVQHGESQFVTVENSAGFVHKSQGRREPLSSDLRSEPKIVAGIATALLGNKKVHWEALTDHYDRIREFIEKAIPGFEDFNGRIRQGGFYLPNGARQQQFYTDTGKANFTVNNTAKHRLAGDEFLLMTIRSHDQFNTTIYGLDDRYRGIKNGRRVVFMNATDCEALALTNQYVNLVSCYDGVERKAGPFLVVPYNIPTQCLAAYFPEANPVVPANHYAHGSQTPISKSVVVRLEIRSKG